jgi:hypothetical protein
VTDDLEREIPDADPDDIVHAPQSSEIDRGADVPAEAEAPADKPEEPNPWLKEGADAPDAADIEDPSEQR